MKRALVAVVVGFVVVLIATIAGVGPTTIPLQDRAAATSDLPPTEFDFVRGESTGEVFGATLLPGIAATELSAEQPGLYFDARPCPHGFLHPLLYVRRGDAVGEVILPEDPFHAAQWGFLQQSSDGARIWALLWQPSSWNAAPEFTRFWVVASEDFGSTWAVFATLERPYGNAETLKNFSMDDSGRGTIVMELDQEIRRPSTGVHAWIRRVVFSKTPAFEVISSVEHTWETTDGGHTWSRPRSKAFVPVPRW